jgi:hypothetical protein
MYRIHILSDKYCLSLTSHQLSNTNEYHISRLIANIILINAVTEMQTLDAENTDNQEDGSSARTSRRVKTHH